MAGDLLALCDTVTGRAEVVRLDRAPDRLPPSAFGANGTPALTRVTWSRDTALRRDRPVRRTVVRGTSFRRATASPGASGSCSRRRAGAAAGPPPEPPGRARGRPPGPRWRSRPASSW
ncbi:hypothetical protein ACFQ0M_10245 [Kitasatospora aburaviensis]